MSRQTTLLHDNLVDYAATLITTGTWSLDLPAENVRHPFLTKVARTGTSAAEESLIFDLSSAKKVEAILIDAHTLTAGDSTIKIQGNASDSWGAPSFSENITYAAGRILHYFASSQTYRYWRFTFTKSASGETRDIGRVFLGSILEMTDEPDFEDVSVDYKDPSDKSRALSGHVYTNQREDYFQLKFSSPAAYANVALSVVGIYGSLGVGRPFYLHLFPDLSDDTYYVVFMSEPSYKTKAWDPEAGEFIVDLQFEVEEFK